VSPVDLEAYVSLEGVIPPDHYVGPHVGVSWTFTQPMAFVHVEGRPRGAARSDRGSGLEYTEIATVLGAGTRYPNLSDTGMVPGAIYDVRVRGEDGLTDLLGPASVSTDGAALEPPLAFDVPLDSPVRSADTRFSFRVSPVRVEAPSRARPVGFNTILPATTHIDAVLRPETVTSPVPSDARVRVRVRRRADGAVLIESDAGLYSTVVAAASPAVLTQAGTDYPVLGFTARLAVPAGSELIGAERRRQPPIASAVSRRRRHRERCR